MKPMHLDDCLIVLEVDRAEPLVGDLFRRRFNIPSFPEEPRHFVALVINNDNSVSSVGYVHYTMWQGCALCGGLVIDDRNYRRLLKPVRQTIQMAGGIAEQLLKQSFSRLPSTLTAIWGHVGDRQSEKVCLRVGFEKTEQKHLLAVWRDLSLTDHVKANWVKRAAARMPF